jgi:hypothetical protein
MPGAATTRVGINGRISRVRQFAEWGGSPAQQQTPELRECLPAPDKDSHLIFQAGFYAGCQ